MSVTKQELCPLIITHDVLSPASCSPCMTQGCKPSQLLREERISLKFRPVFNTLCDSTRSPTPWIEKGACCSSEYVFEFTCARHISSSVILIYFAFCREHEPATANCRRLYYLRPIKCLTFTSAIPLFEAAPLEGIVNFPQHGTSRGHLSSKSVGSELFEIKCGMLDV